ncbi:hypothetical protein GGF46_002258 [Coemansia sp. RSA 552]|nr:hypothetical protein GGF46_002258 [Coemansia sp. RSA 552]
MSHSIYSIHSTGVDDPADIQRTASKSPSLPATADAASQDSKWRRAWTGARGGLWLATQFVIKLLGKTNLTMWIVLGLVLGVIVGHTAPDFGVKIKPLADVFLRMISSLVTPLIFSTLVVGVAAHGDDLVTIGRLAIKSLVYFEVISTLAMLLGLLMVNAIKPGNGAPIAPGDAPQASNSTITWDSELFSIIPQSFYQAAVDGKVLQIVFCALMFAVGLCKVPARSVRQPMIAFLHSLSEIMFKVTGLVMNYAPIGIGCSIAATVGANGLGVFASLGKLVGALYGTLAIFVIVVLGVAAIPRASFVVLSAALVNFDIPDHALSLVLAADAFLDMARTGINVFGNCLAACVIARWEGVYPPYGRWEGRWENMDPRNERQLVDQLDSDSQRDMGFRDANGSDLSKSGIKQYT